MESVFTFSRYWGGAGDRADALRFSGFAITQSHPSSTPAPGKPPAAAWACWPIRGPGLLPTSVYARDTEGTVSGLPLGHFGVYSLVILQNKSTSVDWTRLQCLPALTGCRANVVLTVPCPSDCNGASVSDHLSWKLPDLPRLVVRTDPCVK